MEELEDLQCFISIYEFKGINDKWIWGGDELKLFSTGSCRCWIDRNMAAPLSLKVTWSRWIPVKISCFLWRALQNRIPVARFLVARGVPLQYTACSKCHVEMEDVDHVPKAYISLNMFDSTRYGMKGSLGYALATACTHPWEKVDILTKRSIKHDAQKLVDWASLRGCSMEFSVHLVCCWDFSLPYVAQKSSVFRVGHLLRLGLDIEVPSSGPVFATEVIKSILSHVPITDMFWHHDENWVSRWFWVKKYGW
ncbi:hypothetical protein E3N88_07648 [Mikania micrantha]|uniref:Reverse transcriptase zinc-binding domain-containing protein n=1 Tax=Mikania micrantha TaxID=192012 RepID=A0A5N6PT67_9ASTR|nr:hypothetical protein E3N88_07648 [Mikania micrantha]